MEPLDPRRVLICRAVARAGSISAAARELGWTQPAVSQHLARLERDVGGALLLRGAGGVRLHRVVLVMVVEAVVVVVPGGELGHRAQHRLRQRRLPLTAILLGVGLGIA